MLSKARVKPKGRPRGRPFQKKVEVPVVPEAAPEPVPKVRRTMTASERRDWYRKKAGWPVLREVTT